MSHNILLYGATGYSGGLIAAEMKLWNDEAGGDCRMILAGREAAPLKTLADEHDMDYRVFGLDDRKEVRQGLRDMDVVINAAGPFAWTAERLAKVALEVECHYVDINGEADVYKKLDDLAVHARRRDVAIVCGAGFWSAASDYLLDRALSSLRGTEAAKDGELGAIRIAMSRITTFSRGSVETAWRSLREQVTVARKGEVDDGSGGTKPGLVLWHEPVGKLERTFDFRARSDGKADLRIASAVSLVDTLSARLTVARHNMMARTIESYVETGLARRIVYQIGALVAPLAAMSAVSALVQQPISFLSEGPTLEERESDTHIILLDIEDPFRTRIINWRWETPNVYQFTAQLAVAVAMQVAKGKLEGWCTPAQALASLDASERGRVFRDCHPAEGSS